MSEQLLSARTRRLRWAVFLSGTFGYSLYYVCRLSLSVVKAPLVHEGVLTESQLGLVGSALFYAYAVGKLVNGFLADRANINRFMTIGLLGAAAVNLILGFGPGFYLFSALWLINGWFQSMGAPACIVALSRWFERDERGTYYGIWSASHNIGEGLTFIAVAVLSSNFGWRWGLWGASAAGLLGVIGVSLCFHNRPPGSADQAARSGNDAGRLTPEEKQRVRRAQWLALKHPTIWLIAAASAFMYVARYAINSWGMFFLELGKGYSRIEAGAIISIGSVAGVAGTIASGWISDRWFPHNRFLPALFAGALNALSLAVFLAVPPGYRGADYVCMLGFGLSIGALICNLGGLLAIDCVPKESAGAALGIVGIASYLGAGAQDVVSGFLIEGSKRGIGSAVRYDFLPASLFWVGAAVVSTAITALIWLRSRRSATEASRPRPLGSLAGCFLLIGALAIPLMTSPASAQSELKFALIVSRHGVRAPLDEQRGLDRFASQRFPEWDVPPGHLTLHGRRQMELMGAYYRDRYVHAGLLTGMVETDAPKIFFRANNEQRTLASAAALAAGLLPGAPQTIHAWREGAIDPLFRSARAKVGRVDCAKSAAAVLGRIGGDLRAFELAHQRSFDTLGQVLVNQSAEAPRPATALLSLPSEVAAEGPDTGVSLSGPLRTAYLITELLMLEYAEGFPMKAVGWGRLPPSRFTELLDLHSSGLDLPYGTFYPAQVFASNLASHIADTLAQAATGRVVPGALGASDQKLVVVVAHDSTQIALGGLLGLEWRLPGTQRNPALIGGALVFELRERLPDHQCYVRVLYISPALEQTRELTPLTLDNPPGCSPIFIPGASEAEPGYDAPLARFDALVRRVVDPQFVTPSAL